MNKLSNLLEVILHHTPGGQSRWSKPQAARTQRAFISYRNTHGIIERYLTGKILWSTSIMRSRSGVRATCVEAGRLLLLIPFRSCCADPKCKGVNTMWHGENKDSSLDTLPGQVFLLQAMAQASRTFSARPPSVPLLCRSSRIRWLSEPPKENQMNILEDKKGLERCTLCSDNVYKQWTFQNRGTQWNSPVTIL